MSDLERLEWRHPYLGEVVEVICVRHRRQVLAALRTLGIGSGGTTAKAGACLRCAHDGARPALWLAGVAVPPVVD